MKNIEWKYLNSPTTEGEIRETENFLNVQFPEDYSSFIIKYNGARPEANIIKLQSGRELIFERLLRIENYITDSVSVYTESLRERGNQELVPFGSDPFGNFFCFNFKKSSKGIVFWDHESDESETFIWICKSFSEMLNLLNYEEK